MCLRVLFELLAPKGAEKIWLALKNHCTLPIYFWSEEVCLTPDWRESLRSVSPEKLNSAYPFIDFIQLAFLFASHSCIKRHLRHWMPWCNHWEEVGWSFSHSKTDHIMCLQIEICILFTFTDQILNRENAQQIPKCRTLYSTLYFHPWLILWHVLYCNCNSFMSLVFLSADV